ncbi:neuroendocrine protein 7B2-like isoform X2 [Physella acuta]|uniref:neuroendocrine protein 7B2-like isoform X2 n=1 Tax=Physella acuta TaxID=109671 RepID=UPI0027DD9436|nr:neuroendocrine protein 7B2-like isoform X2 [Physella acuta]
MGIFLLISPILIGMALASYDPYMDMAQLYRMQLLANSISDYLPETRSVDSQDEEMYWPDLDDGKTAIYNDALYSGAHPRDQEHIEHSDLHGFQSVSGGTAEGAPNAKQVKTDKQLPAYCNPPNPCPVGKTAKDNCVENFVNSAENNQKLLSEQDCPCDTEHMFTCPAGSQTVSSKGQGNTQQMNLNKVIDELAKMEHNGEKLENNPSMSATRKRLTVVAKKSPHMIKKRSEISDHGNPFLQGEKMDIAAKKDPTLAKNSMHNWRFQHN